LCIVSNSAADAADRMTLEAVSADFEWLREHLADCGPKIARDLTEKAVRPFWSVAADLVANLVAEISFDQLAAELW
jgi:TorA maturation chaperone TorD